MSKYTSKTKNWLKINGYLEWTVERYIFATKQRIDLFNCIDVMAINPMLREAVGVQSTGPSGKSEHNHKLLNSGLALAWVKSGLKLWLFAWKLRPKVKGGKQMKWIPDVIEYTEEMFTEIAWSEYESL